MPPKAAGYQVFGVSSVPCSRALDAGSPSLNDAGRDRVRRDYRGAYDPGHQLNRWRRPRAAPDTTCEGQSPQCFGAAVLSQEAMLAHFIPCADGGCTSRVQVPDYHHLRATLPPVLRRCCPRLGSLQHPISRVRTGDVSQGFKQPIDTGQRLWPPRPRRRHEAATHRARFKRGGQVVQSDDIISRARHAAPPQPCRQDDLDARRVGLNTPHPWIVSGPQPCARARSRLPISGSQASGLAPARFARARPRRFGPHTKFGRATLPPRPSAHAQTAYTPKSTWPSGPDGRARPARARAICVDAPPDLGESTL